MRLLLVEDEELLRGIVAKGLRNLGYAVDEAQDGEEALYLYEINEYDLLVLDLNLPKVDGLEVLRRIRTTNAELRVLILSARSQVDDRVLGLNEGANDYLVKPFDFRELEARIRSLLHRRFAQSPAVLGQGPLQLDTKAKSACINGQALQLTRKEYGILEYLMLHPGQVVSAEELMEHVWSSELDPFSNTLRYHIHSLKKKLSDAAGQEFIQTLRGQGYRMGEGETV